MLDFLIAFFTDYGYLAVFGILVLCGFGLPVPEDITLVSGGVISGLDLANPHTMCIVGLAGVLFGDSTMFIAGRIFGYRIQRIRLFRRILSPRRFSFIQRQFKKYGLTVLFVARFLPGLRSPIYLVAGMSRRISYITFVLMDGFAALISVPVWVYLGYFFADNLDLLMSYVTDVQHLIWAVIGLFFVLVLIFILKKKFHSITHKMLHSDAPAAAAKATSAQKEASEVINKTLSKTKLAQDLASMQESEAVAVEANSTTATTTEKPAEPASAEANTATDPTALNKESTSVAK